MSPRGAATAQAAYVLHRYDWSESSLIVDLFSRDLGRLVVAAKGAKRPTSQLRAVLRPFQRVHIMLGRTAQGAEVHNLRAAEWAGGVPVAGGEALLSGFYANELIMKLLARDDPHPALWDAYAATLPQLGGASEASALRAFELTLLAETGHLPDLAHVSATQQPVDPESGYALRAEAGLVNAGLERNGDDAALGGADAIALQAALARRDLGALRVACAPCEPVLRRQLRRWLAYHLGGIPLRTRDVMRDLQPLLSAR